MYLNIALIVWAFDGAMSVSSKTRFNVFISLFFSLLWPVVLPLTVVMAAFVTYNYPDER